MSTPEHRARTLVATTTMVEVGVLDQRAVLRRHAVDGAGAVLFDLTDAAPQCAARARPGTPGPVMDLVGTDVSSVPGPDRVRGVVRMSGPVELVTEPLREDLRAHLGLPDGGLVGRLAPDALTLDWRVETDGATTLSRIGAEDYAAARVDALGGWEDGWVAHLDADHPAVLHTLATRHGDVPEGSTVRPVMADELGIVLRVVSGRSTRDVRVPFPRRVSCGCEAVWALNALVGPGC